MQAHELAVQGTVRLGEGDAGGEEVEHGPAIRAGLLLGGREELLEVLLDGGLFGLQAQVVAVAEPAILAEGGVQTAAGAGRGVHLREVRGIA